MADFEHYSRRYECVKMRREDGILELTLHTDEGELSWGAVPHRELPEVFHDIAGDRENRVVILTGTGDAFSGPRPSVDVRQGRTAYRWSVLIEEGRALLTNLLNIEAPMISAVNGPALRHSELPLLCDIVLASDNAAFEDAGHFESGLTPGDGVNIIYPMLLGINRARYFLFTGQSLDAHEAKQLGLVAEVLPRDRLLDRAWELARGIARHSDLHLRNTRRILTMEIRKKLEAHLELSLSLEAMANMRLNDPA
jgi:enoyl-CoA hydratase/carnithine racemase